jgi:exodeoxyribonuclease III
MNTSFYSYNVNGLRSAISKGFDTWLQTSMPDFICLQEIKATPDQIDTSFLERLGYNHFWYPAQKKGYSGVAVFCKQKPDNVIYGMGINNYDTEGRLIRTDFSDITHLAVYFPSGTSGDIRQLFKMQFLIDFDNYITSLQKHRPNLIISADWNIAHTEIDINHPKKHTKMSGFLPEERAWVDSFLAKGFTDTFRIFNNEANQYSWWSYRANSRAKNLGWRIDYQLVTNNLADKIKSANIHTDVVHSDHCPISIILNY